jgi:hypothetical protein
MIDKIAYNALYGLLSDFAFYGYPATKPLAKSLKTQF